MMPSCPKLRVNTNTPFVQHHTCDYLQTIHSIVSFRSDISWYFLVSPVAVFIQNTHLSMGNLHVHAPENNFPGYNEEWFVPLM